MAHYIIMLFSSRYFHWNLGLYLMLFMVIVLIPFYIGYFVLSNIHIGKLVCSVYKQENIGN